MENKTNSLPVLGIDKFEKIAVGSPSNLKAANEILMDRSSKNAIAPGSFFYQDIRGVQIGTNLHFHNCYVKTWNRLLYPDGTPISARGVAYYFSGIQWCPGAGWPTYSSRCPLAVSSPAMVYPQAKSHQLIVQFGGFGWIECSNSNAGIGNQITDVFVGVNDDLFNDNTGTFEFIISSILV